MERVDIILRGTKPLLMNRMTPEVLEALFSKQKKAKTAQRPTAQEEAASKVYTGGDGNPVMPVENLMACLIEAGRFVRLEGKKMVSSAGATVLPGMLTIEDTTLPLFSAESLKTNASWNPATWVYDLRQGRNPNGNEAVAIVRPRFDSWAIKLTCQLDYDQLSEVNFRSLFDFAGKRVGLGDFRPQRKGIFGQFVVNHWAPTSIISAA